MSLELLWAASVLALTPLERIVQPDVVWVLIPITVILTVGVGKILKAQIQHRERMAKIGMGIDPDALEDRDERASATSAGCASSHSC